MPDMTATFIAKVMGHGKNGTAAAGTRSKNRAANSTVEKIWIQISVVRTVQALTLQTSKTLTAIALTGSKATVVRAI
jgi:hypothetical protein